jgi:hypothetical protein
LPRLYYNRDSPYQKEVTFYNFYRDTASVEAPRAYVLPQGWWKVVERLKANGVTMTLLKKDTIIEVEAYRILAYRAATQPYEGHRPNSKVQVRKETKNITFRAGDYLIPFAQSGWHYLVQTLEPEAEDSFFSWNFFDAVLQQKEGYSDYVFEDTAAFFLAANPQVKAALEAKQKEDPAFAKNGAAQLDFVYKASPFYEPGHMQYPVFRIAAK